VERLVISSCEITSNVLAQLLSAPSLTDKLTRLQELNLSKNCLNDDVFATLTKLLKSSRKLQSLNLNENSISF
jgi:Ran GTPase-activating protein (RanGAP) involved in mRNA processing and transport